MPQKPGVTPHCGTRSSTTGPKAHSPQDSGAPGAQEPGLWVRAPFPWPPDQAERYGRHASLALIESFLLCVGGDGGSCGVGDDGGGDNGDDDGGGCQPLLTSGKDWGYWSLEGKAQPQSLTSHTWGRHGNFLNLIFPACKVEAANTFTNCKASANVSGFII